MKKISVLQLFSSFFLVFFVVEFMNTKRQVNGLLENIERQYKICETKDYIISTFLIDKDDLVENQKLLRKHVDQLRALMFQEPNEFD